jgi:antitoxin component YwqK of YwqJK toxin-antitoxin module
MSETEQCYYCYGEESAEEPFALDPKPCACTGSIMLHKTCLQQLIQRSNTCSICINQYNLAYLPRLEELEELEEEDGYIIENNGCFKNKYKVNEAGQRHGLLKVYIKYANYPYCLVRKINYVNGILEGLCEEFYNSGRLQHKCNFINGKMEGLYEIFYEDGSLRQYYNFINGKKEGVSETWHLNGQLISRSNYVNNEEEGLYEGWHYSNGQLRRRCNLVNGNLEGLCEEWNEDGTLKESANYLAGEIVSQ